MKVKMSPNGDVKTETMSAFEMHLKKAQVQKKKFKARSLEKKNLHAILKNVNISGKRPPLVLVKDNDLARQSTSTAPLVTAMPKKKVLKLAKNGMGVQLKRKRKQKEKLKVVASKKKQVVEEGKKDTNLNINDPSPCDSIEEGKKLFSWLIEPIDSNEFFSNAWEKRPMHVKRHFPDYYKSLLSIEMIDNILRANFIQFSVNVDVTSYRNGKRETHNPLGRALPSIVWSYYNKGCSVRMLNPQTFAPKLGLLSATLQEYLGCFVGANSYLTPPDSQGFAPHYDDIEAFILQLEGKKNWKLYAPRTDEETLPRFSSKNFAQDEIGEPIMEVTLCPGDLLYFPRGTIHQASTVPGHHSLHVTLSCYQRNSWGDLMEKLLPAALTLAMEEDIEFRKGLPRDYLHHLGIVHSDLITLERERFLEHLHQLLRRLHQYLPVDAAVDQMGKQFLHDALPPILSLEERQCSSFDGAEKLGVDGKLITCKDIYQDTKVKLLRAHILRLVKDLDEDMVQVYHCVDNTLEYHAVEPQFFNISIDLAPGVEFLIHSYPKFVSVQMIPLESMELRVEVAKELWKRGLLLTEKPLTSVQT